MLPVSRKYKITYMLCILFLLENMALKTVFQGCLGGPV